MTGSSFLLGPPLEGVGRVLVVSECLISQGRSTVRESPEVKGRKGSDPEAGDGSWLSDRGATETQGRREDR